MDQKINSKMNVESGIQHTSASLIVQENADPDVQTDLLKYFDNLAPMDKKYISTPLKGKMICLHI